MSSQQATAPRSAVDAEPLHGSFNFVGTAVFILALVVGAGYAGSQLIADLDVSRAQSMMPFILLGIALLIALGFEFVNGFHDTANAVATVIYTHSMHPHIAVVWSGTFNFLGVMASTGAVAFGIVSLLPVELILQVGSSAGFAMVFALLIAAIIWNVGTWYFGLPSSSSHTLIGSIIGVGLMNQIMAVNGTATSGVDWSQTVNIGKALLFSPLIGFAASALLLLAAKALIKRPELYSEPQPGKAPPLWVRGLLILTCTGVSFAHGSNDGQKGMGLIMLILIGTVPTSYALNRAVGANEVPHFEQVSDAASLALQHYVPMGVEAPTDGHDAVTAFVRSHDLKPETIPAVRAMILEIKNDVAQYGALSNVPTDQVRNVRNDMYLVSESLRIMDKAGSPKISTEDAASLKAYKGGLDRATKFIPTWVKVAVAVALGLGTMVGWKRIVVTVGEKIGKAHLTYAQGASAEIVAMATIGAADAFGLPVSTTHVLSSGVAGTMAANGSGLQWGTVRNLIMAWVLTLPASILLSGLLFFVFRHLF